MRNISNNYVVIRFNGNISENVLIDITKDINITWKVLTYDRVYANTTDIGDLACKFLIKRSMQNKDVIEARGYRYFSDILAIKNTYRWGYKYGY